MPIPLGKTTREGEGPSRAKITRRGQNVNISYRDSQGLAVSFDVPGGLAAAKALAEKINAAIDGAVARSKPIDKARARGFASWGDAQELFMAEKKSKRSINLDASRFRILRGLGFAPELPLARVTQEFVDLRLLAIPTGRRGRMAGAATRNRYRALIRSALRLALFRGLAPAVASIKLEPEPENAPRAFSKRELARIVAAAPDHMRAPIIVAATTGLRRSNVFNLRCSQIDFDARVIKIPPEESKSGRLMAIPMPRACEAAILDELSKPSAEPGYVFRYNGRRLKSIGQRSWARLLRECGVPYAPWHSLRHTFATNLARAGFSEAEMMALGGWRVPAAALPRQAHEYRERL